MMKPQQKVELSQEKELVLKKINFINLNTNSYHLIYYMKIN